MCANQSLSVDELDAALRAAEARGVAVRALAVINPGNPTGQVMEYADVARVAEWAAEKQLVLLANFFDDPKEKSRRRSFECDPTIVW